MSARCHARLTIDVAAVRANYRRARALAGAAACGAAVKADAYGLGAATIVPALAAEGCRAFFVATLDEALDVRRLAPDAEVFLLTGLPRGTAREVLAERITPVLNTVEEALDWRMASEHAPEAAGAALQLDTGMTRAGLGADDLERLRASDVLRPPFRTTLVLTHFASADDPADPSALEQARCFRTLCSGLPPARTSLANSAALLRGAPLVGDLARPGVFLYGGRPSPVLEAPRPVVCLQGRILQVRRLERDARVGYGATASCARGRRLATVGVGYADGYPRALGNRGVAALGEWRLPVVGRVSMDMINVDVTDAPESVACAGAWVDLIGGRAPLDDVAAAAETIGYELLTRLARRAAREYLDEPAARRPA